jgi:hypothetical protein
MKVLQAGGTPVRLASGQGGVGRGIAVDGASVYWTRNGVGGAGNGTVMKMPVDGGAPTALASGTSNATAIAVDARSIYWVSFDIGGGSLMRMPLDGGTPTTLASRVSPSDLAVDATNVYFTMSAPDYVDHGAVMKLGATTCESGQCRCPGTQTLCFGACVDPTSDGANCGACGTACPTGTTCRASHCQ